MMDKCFDEGTIQTFLDGELSPREIDRVTAHVAVCDLCALALAEAEQESAYAYAALEKEFDTLVPTQRLWTKINDSIENDAAQAGFWQKISVYLSTPLAASCAGLLIAFGLFAGILTFIDSQTGDIALLEPDEDMRVLDQTGDELPVFLADPPVSVTAAAAEQGGGEKPAPVVQLVSRKRNPVTGRKSATRRSTLKTRGRRPGSGIRNGSPGDGSGLPGGGSVVAQSEEQTADAPGQNEAEFKLAPPNTVVTGEGTYLRTIAALEEKVNDRKDLVLNASARFSYERDLALANDVISKMKTEVSRNPDNIGAREVLRSAYQNKIDLLKSVSEKTELLASLD